MALQKGRGHLSPTSGGGDGCSGGDGGSDKKDDSSFLFNQWRLKREKPKPTNYPIENKFLQRKGNKVFRVAACSMQGRRETMEDAHTIELNMKHHDGCGYFAVFDGHDGRDVSAYCAENLWKKVDECDVFSQETITKKFLELDDELKHFNSGCTATFVIVDTKKSVEAGGYHVTVGNLGDSRSLIGHYSNPDARCLTVDHKPTLPEETARIQAAGGLVLRNRVDSSLAVSRAFGDWQYKANTHLSKDKQKVICLPDVTETFVGPDDFIFICCDGIFESFTNETAIKYVHDQLKETKDLATILSDLLSATLKGGSRDNMTAMLITCTDGTDYHQQTEEFIPGKYYPNGNESFLQGYRIDCENHGLKWSEIEKNLPRPDDEFSTAAGGERPLSAKSQPSLPDKPVISALKPPRFGSQSTRNLTAKMPPGFIQKIEEEEKEKSEKTEEKVEEKPPGKPERGSDKKQLGRSQSGKVTKERRSGLVGKVKTSATLKSAKKKK